MKVKELREELKYCNDDDIVVLSSDAEGNTYRKLWQIDEMAWGDGDMYYRKLTPEMRENGYEEEDVRSGEGIINVIVFYPED